MADSRFWTRVEAEDFMASAAPAPRFFVVSGVLRVMFFAASLAVSAADLVPSTAGLVASVILLAASPVTDLALSMPLSKAPRVSTAAGAGLGLGSTFGCSGFLSHAAKTTRAPASRNEGASRESIRPPRFVEQ